MYYTEYQLKESIFELKGIESFYKILAVNIKTREINLLKFKDFSIICFTDSYNQKWHFLVKPLSKRHANNIRIEYISEMYFNKLILKEQLTDICEAV